MHSAIPDSVENLGWESLSAKVIYPPEMQEMQEQRNFHEVDSAADIVVSEHDEALAEFERRLLEQVGLPMTLQDLLQRHRVDLGGVFAHQFTQEDAILGLKQLDSIYYSFVR